VLVIDLEEENAVRRLVFVHNLWINLWIATVIACKTQLSLVLL
jgi:hypothetical protein